MPSALPEMHLDLDVCGLRLTGADRWRVLWGQGYRVLVVEQVETPDQLEVRKRETGSKDRVSGGSDRWCLKTAPQLVVSSHGWME